MTTTTAANFERCILCQHLPDVTYDQPKDLWIVGCSCSRIVKVCGAGHSSFDEALICWNKIVADCKGIAA